MTEADEPTCPHMVTRIGRDEAGDEIRVCVDCDDVFPS